MVLLAAGTTAYAETCVRRVTPQHGPLLPLQGPTAGATAPADMKRRLSAMLADPNMRLPDLAAELVQLGGLPAGEAQQKAMEAALNRMLVRSGGAYKALSTGMTAALQMALLAGPPGESLRADSAKWGWWGRHLRGEVQV